MSKKSKRISFLVAGIFLGVVLAVLLACNWGNSAVFELQEGEAEKLGVVFPEGKDLISLYDEYMEKKEYDKAIVVAKKMEGYNSLETAYLKAGKYEEALAVNEKLMEADNGNDFRQYGYILKRALILEQLNRPDQAIETLKEYQSAKECKNDQDCLKSMERLMSGIEKAKSEGTKFLPTIIHD
ncbi:MAG: hypothetical protein V1688_02670 [bacterium]